MTKPLTIGISVASGILLTAIGVLENDGWLGALLTPGRLFNRSLGFDHGPPEEGVVYGLLFNSVAIAGLVLAVIYALHRWLGPKVNDHNDH